MAASSLGAGVAQLVTDLRQLMKLSELTRKQSDATNKRHGVDDLCRSVAPHKRFAMANDFANRAAAVGVAFADVAVLRGQQSRWTGADRARDDAAFMRHSRIVSAYGN